MIKAYGYLHFTNNMEHRFTRLKPRGELYPHLGEITEVFTESQLKAEVEKAIKQCADICVENSKEFNDPFQGVRASHRILALLVNQGASLSSIDTDERKEK
jgi:hypothetical protein